MGPDQSGGGWCKCWGKANFKHQSRRDKFDVGASFPRSLLSSTSPVWLHEKWMCRWEEKQDDTSLCGVGKKRLVLINDNFCWELDFRARAIHYSELSYWSFCLSSAGLFWGHSNKSFFYLSLNFPRLHERYARHSLSNIAYFFFLFSKLPFLISWSYLFFLSCHHYLPFFVCSFLHYLTAWNWPRRGFFHECSVSSALAS